MDLPGIDVLGAARRLGCDGESVEKPGDLHEALVRALNTERPFVLDVRADPSSPKSL